jgi:cell volume regulation protein A
MFHDEISFFLKTFFFVYIGMLLNINDGTAWLLGGVIAAGLMLLRLASCWLVRGYDKVDRKLIHSLFARGIASAVIMLMAVRRGMNPEALILNTVYVVISTTILLSSLRVFLFRLYMKHQEGK